MKKKPLIFIVLLNWNGKQDTLECLRSLKSLDYDPYRIVIVDNGSEDGSVEAFKSKFPHIPLIETGENLGYAGGNNVGITYSMQHGADLVLLLNNDAVVDKNLLKAFVDAYATHPDAGVFGAQILRYYPPHKVEHFGGTWNRKKCEFESFGKNQIDVFQTSKYVDYVCGCAILIKKQVVDKIGLLDPKFFLLWEESDYCFRTKRAGFQILAVADALVKHKISASFTGEKPEMHYYWWRNRLLWIKKNRSFKERSILYFRTLFPQIIKIYKLKFLKSFQLFLLRLFSSSANNKKRYAKLACYKAGCAGIQDYFLKNFGILGEKKKKKFFSNL